MSGSDSVRMSTSVEAARQVALEIWCAERPAEDFGVHGLNTERAVRDRLQSIAKQIEALPDVHEGVSLRLDAINFSSDDTLTVLERTEQLLLHFRPGTHAQAEELLQDGNPVLQLLLRLIIVQSLSARMGRWSVRGGEIPDARTARALYRHLGETHWSQHRALLERADKLHSAEKYVAAATTFLDADRLTRTSNTLLRAATAFTAASEYTNALWTVRVCLLEPRASYSSAGQLERATRLESRLRGVIEGRASMPISHQEARALVLDGEEPVPLVVKKAKSAPEVAPDAQLFAKDVRLKKLFPSREDEPMTRVASFAKAPPEKRPSEVSAARTEALMTERMSLRSSSIRGRSALFRPRRHATATNGRQLEIVEDRDPSNLATERQKIDLSKLVQSFTDQSSEESTEIPAERVAAHAAVTVRHDVAAYRPKAYPANPSISQLVSETFELDLGWDDGESDAPTDIARASALPTARRKSSRPATLAPVPSEAIGDDGGAQMVSKAASRVEAPAADTKGAVYEVTERIRTRSQKG